MYTRFTCLLLLLSLLALAGPARADLVSQWMFDEGSGTVATDSGPGGNDGTFVGKPTWVPGVSGSAVEIHGQGTAGNPLEYIDCGNGKSLDITSKISITLWIRPQADDPEGKATTTAPMAKADMNQSNSWSWQVRYGWNSPKPFMSFTFYSTPRAWAYVNKKLTRDEWCHIAGTHDGTTLKCYLNGEETDSTPMGVFNSSPTPVLIGSDGWGCDWIGAIDDVRIYNHALTADEVAAICPPPRIARNPDPADGAKAVLMPLLRWKAGYKAVSHEVYIGTSPDLGPANRFGPRSPALMCYYTLGLQPGVTYYWRVDEVEADGVTINTGNVWSFTAQALTAYLPDPADGATDASTNPMLTWMPGQAALKHHVYFGGDADAVGQGTAAADKGEVTDPNFAPGALEPATTYYWRVDETVAGGPVRAGAVWSFTTCVPVDDFESYNDEEGQNTRIYETWIDGYSDGSSGSTVGYTDPPFAEQKIVHSGRQSMPLDYNNINEPFYSEAVREFDPVQDWTIGDVNTLVLYVRGRTSNAPAPLYLILEDSARHSALVVQPDAAVLTQVQWAAWKIPLSDFAGVNPARIRKLYLGVGDKESPSQGGTGLLYIDDIQVVK